MLRPIRTTAKLGILPFRTIASIVRHHLALRAEASRRVRVRGRRGGREQRVDGGALGGDLRGELRISESPDVAIRQRADEL